MAALTKMLRRPKPTDKPVVLVKPFGDPIGVEQDDGTHVVPYRKRPKHPSFRRIALSPELLDNTSYVAVFDENRIVQVNTVQPDGVLLGWDRCIGCHRHVSRCRCHQVTPPRYVVQWQNKSATEHAYGSTVANAQTRTASDDGDGGVRKRLSKRLAKTMHKHGDERRTKLSRVKHVNQKGASE